MTAILAPIVTTFPVQIPAGFAPSDIDGGRWTVIEATVITAIGALLTALAPEVAKAITGGQSTEDAIKAAQDAQKKIPVLEDKGTWDDDLDERKKRG